MAKKGKFNFIAFILIAVLLLSSLCACSDGQSKAKTITTKVVNSFASEKELYQVILSNGYGKLTLNKDQKYSSDGGSAALWVSDQNGLPMLFKQRLVSQVSEYNYANLKQIKNVKTSIYNSAEEDVEVIFALEFSDGSKSASKKYTLKTGWNELVYDVDRSMLSLQFDIEKAVYLSYTFQTNQTPYTVYVDNISVGITNSEVQEVVQTVEKDEICLFDKNNQMTAFSLYVYSTIRIGNFVDFGLTANPDRVKSGKSFYVTTVKGTEEAGNAYWIRLNDKYSKLVDWKSLTENDKISFWVFNEGPYTSMQFNVVTKRGALANNFFYVEANSWINVEIPVSDIIQKTNDKGFLEKGEVIGDVIDYIRVGWPAFDNVAQKTLYFDEFKIIRGGVA